MKKLKSFELICKKCKQKNHTILLRHDGACGDPECCGSRTYYGIRIECKCGKTEEVDCEEEE